MSKMLNCQNHDLYLCHAKLLTQCEQLPMRLRWQSKVDSLRPFLFRSHMTSVCSNIVAYIYTLIKRAI
jgi:hypothetical protein